MAPEPADAGMQQSMFNWDTLREVRPHTLPFKESIHGSMLEVELTCGEKVNVVRAHDGLFYFCHGLTFGGKDAPGGAISPFSGQSVQTILQNYYVLVSPESDAVVGDILVWWGSGDQTPHSAILTVPVLSPARNYLDYRSQLRSKNGKLPEATMTLERLVDGPDSYGESYNVYRRK
jgi:hypothetical protein